MESELLSRVIAGLSVSDWARVAGIWAAVSVGLLGFKWLVVGRVDAVAKRTKNNIDDMIAVVLKRTLKLFLILIALYVAVQFVARDAPAVVVIRRIILLGALVQAGIWGNALVGFWSKWYVERQGDDGQAQVTAVGAVGLVARIIVWSVLLILALDNFGVDITALVAGLGIGGIAIALAVQNVLQDLLAYISIIIDKPFMHGDFLVLGEYTGSVEHIGIKTTRLRSLSGEQLIISNNDLLSSRIRNYKRMYERRVVMEVGVTYSTPHSLLEQIPTTIREIIESQEDIRFDRAHLKSFGDSAIKFEAVFYVTKPDYVLFMDRQQAMNLALHSAFEKAGIDFAFPSQSIYIESMPERETVETE